MKMYWIGYTQTFDDGDWRNNYHHGFREAVNAQEALKVQYGNHNPPHLIQVFEWIEGERILRHTVGLH